MATEMNGVEGKDIATFEEFQRAWDESSYAWQRQGLLHGLPKIGKSWQEKNEVRQQRRDFLLLVAEEGINSYSYAHIGSELVGVYALRQIMKEFTGIMYEHLQTMEADIHRQRILKLLGNRVVRNLFTNDRTHGRLAEEFLRASRELFDEIQRKLLVTAWIDDDCQEYAYIGDAWVYAVINLGCFDLFINRRKKDYRPIADAHANYLADTPIADLQDPSIGDYIRHEENLTLSYLKYEALAQGYVSKSVKKSVNLL
jgi:hypothetical protein